MNEQEKDVLGQGFSFNNISNFDMHINLSIPNYDLLTSIIQSIAPYFITDNSFIYDIGCSTGLLLKNIYIDTLREFNNVQCIGYEVAENLFKPELFNTGYYIYNKDITKKDVTYHNASLILSVFTLQFVDQEYRTNILQRIYDGLKPGGAFIICEKLYQENGKLQEIFTFSYYDFKAHNFSIDQIFGKQLKLRSILRPNSEQQLITSLKNVGFNTISKFFQTLHFAAYLCIKD